MSSDLRSIYFLILLVSSNYTQDGSLSESVEYDPIGNRFFSGNDATSIIEIETTATLSYFGAETYPLMVLNL